MGVLDAESVKIDMRLYGEITPVQASSDFRMNFVTDAFYVFRCVGDNKSFPVVDKIFQPLQRVGFGVILKALGRIGVEFFFDVGVLGDGGNVRHGLAEKIVILIFIF